MSASLLGTQLRQVFDRDVAAVYADLGMEGYRPRYTPILRVLAERGPQSIRDLAIAVAVTHSAGSQTVAQLVREGHATLESGDDARQHPHQRRRGHHHGGADLQRCHHAGRQPTPGL